MPLFTPRLSRLRPRAPHHRLQQPLAPRRQQLQQRSLHLAPPFLVDDPYIPRYLQLSSVEGSKKRSAAYAHLSKCNLCPRLCNVNRFETTGHCLIGGSTVSVNTIAPHFGEEPCLQGVHGSGSVFFSGCNLRCVFCQNHDIAHRKAGFDLAPEELAEWLLRLQTTGRCHNVNFVTPEHVVPQVVLAVLLAADMGLRIPIVYNTSAFDSLASIELLDGIVDIYLPDFKVWEAGTARRLLKAEGYREAACESVKAMHDQVGDLVFTPDGLAKRGVLVRHLVMPGYASEGVEIVRWLAEHVSPDLMMHVMEQYFPRAHVGKKGRGKEGRQEVRYRDINRPVQMDEVDVVKKAAREAGLWRFVEAAEHGGWV